MSTEVEEKMLVNDLTRRQLKKLRANSYKSHWRDDIPSRMFRRLCEEVGELGEVLMEGDSIAISLECADVANFAAMIHDLAGEK